MERSLSSRSYDWRRHISVGAMQTYVFYPRREDGADLAFEAHECADDAEALVRAETVLRTNASCLVIAVWQGDRHVGTRGDRRVWRSQGPE